MVALAWILIIIGLLFVFAGIIEDGSPSAIFVGIVVILVAVIFVMPGYSDDIDTAIKKNSISQISGTVTQITANNNKKSIEINDRTNYEVTDKIADIDLAKIHLGDTVKIEYLEGSRWEFIKSIEVLQSSP
jgi:hypothetical protein